MTAGRPAHPLDDNVLHALFDQGLVALHPDVGVTVAA